MPAATAAHAFAEFFALLGRHLFPAPHHLASPTEPAASGAESPKQKPPQHHQSHGLPKCNGAKAEKSRHQIIPKMRDHETEYREGHDGDGRKFQSAKYSSSSHVHSPCFPAKSS